MKLLSLSDIYEVKAKPQIFTKKTYDSYGKVLVKKSTGPGEEDFDVSEEVRLKTSNDIVEFIQSFKDLSMSPEDIVRQCLNNGMNLEEAGLAYDPEKDAVDMSHLANNVPDFYNQVAKAAANKPKDIDPELLRGRSEEEFLRTVNQSQLDNYINDKINATLSSLKKGEEK